MYYQRVECVIAGVLAWFAGLMCALMCAGWSG
jgi:hypothetical protein